jgi:hypothetical protein
MCIGIYWILVEASSVLLPTFDARDWAMRAHMNFFSAA